MADTYRIRFVIDPDAQFEECNGESRPLTEEEYAEAEYMRDGSPVSYADYLAYYGNPERHVYMGAILDRRCDCCEQWRNVDSLWGIDCMDDNPEVEILTHSDRRFGQVSQYYMLPSELESIPGYLQSVAKELLPDDSEVVTRNDADLITAICGALQGYHDDDGVTWVTCLDKIRALMAVRCEPVTGPDARD